MFFLNGKISTGHLEWLPRGYLTFSSSLWAVETLIGGCGPDIVLA